MGAFLFNPTAEIFTGNPATVGDVYLASPPFVGYPWPNGARNAPGRPTYWQASLTSTVGKYRYVLYNPTAAVTITAGGPVYWKDATFTVVTPTASEGPAGMNGIAGAVLNANLASGAGAQVWCWIQVAGYNASLLSAASVAAGDILFGNATAMTVTRAINGAAAPIQKPFYTAWTAVSGGLSAGQITCEDFGSA